MPVNEGESSPRRARRPKPPSSDLDIQKPRTPLTPMQRLDGMVRDRIEALESDKSILDERLESARAESLRQERDNAALREQNAVLKERLDDQRAWDVLATLLVGGGGLLLGAAAYLPKIGATSGLIGFGLFAAGLLMQAIRLFKSLRDSNS